MPRYALVTAAYNEDKYIESTIKSIVSQSVLPGKWIIVSDGSTDQTDSIVISYAAQYPFIHLYRIVEDHPRNFTAQVYAINRGLAELDTSEFDFIGNLDADITLAPDYFAKLLTKFDDAAELGLAGGAIFERSADGEFRPRPTNAPTSVAHACQLFRRACLQAIGGKYVPLPYGGPDWHAEVMARIMNWRVETFSDLKVYHHRPTNQAEGTLRGCFRQGKMDYSMGSLPFFELFKLLRRVKAKPRVLGSAFRCAGFLTSYWRREKRVVEPEFVAYLRAEQRRRVREVCRLARRANPRNNVPSEG